MDKKYRVNDTMDRRSNKAALSCLALIGSNKSVFGGESAEIYNVGVKKSSAGKTNSGLLDILSQLKGLV